MDTSSPKAQPTIDSNKLSKAESRCKQQQQTTSGNDRFVAIGCQMVGVKSTGNSSALARISIVNYNGNTVLDEFIKPSLPVEDYCGIAPEILETAGELKAVKAKVKNVVKNHIVIGYDIESIMRVLKVKHPLNETRNTALYQGFRFGLMFDIPLPSLKELAKHVLWPIYLSEKNDSLDDAKINMQLYRKRQFQWEYQIELHGLESTYTSKNNMWLAERSIPKNQNDVELHSLEPFSISKNQNYSKQEQENLKLVPQIQTFVKKGEPQMTKYDEVDRPSQTQNQAQKTKSGGPNISKNSKVNFVNEHLETSLVQKAKSKIPIKKGELQTTKCDGIDREPQKQKQTQKIKSGQKKSSEVKIADEHVENSSVQKEQFELQTTKSEEMNREPQKPKQTQKTKNGQKNKSSKTTSVDDHHHDHHPDIKQCQRCSPETRPTFEQFRSYFIILLFMTLFILSPEPLKKTLTFISATIFWVTALTVLFLPKIMKIWSTLNVKNEVSTFKKNKTK